MENKDEELLKKDILLLSEKISGKKNKLFLMRFHNIIDINNNYDFLQNISDIKFEIGNDDNWSIMYTHTTDKYNPNDYNYNSDSDEEIDDKKKITNIKFGKKNKYYINREQSSRFIVYRNSKKELRILNSDYDIELDLDEHVELIEKYSNNIHIPEYVAIRVFLFISENDWEDESITAYFSII